MTTTKTLAFATAAFVAAATCLWAAPEASEPQKPAEPTTFGEAYKLAQTLRGKKQKEEAAAMALKAAELAQKPDDKATALWYRGDIYWDKNTRDIQEKYGLEALAVEGISPARRVSSVKDILAKIYVEQGAKGLEKARNLVKATLEHPSMSNATHRIDISAALANVEFENFKVDDARGRLAALESISSLTTADKAQILRARTELEKKIGDYAAACALLKRIYDDKAQNPKARLDAATYAIWFLREDNKQEEALALARAFFDDSSVEVGGKHERLADTIVRTEVSLKRIDAARKAIAALAARKPADARGAAAIDRAVASLTYFVDFAEGKFEACRAAILADPGKYRGTTETKDLSTVFFNRGEYAKAAEIGALFWNRPSVPWGHDHFFRSIPVAYWRSGNPKGAAEILRGQAETMTGVSEGRRLGFKMAAKFYENGSLSKGDARGMTTKVEPKVARDAFQEAAKQLVSIGKIEEPRMLYEMRKALFVPHRRNIAPVRYVRNAPTDVGSWKASGLATEKNRNVCDMKFGKQNAERLITDVAVARGDKVNASGEAEDDRPIAWFWVCYDEYGIHLMFEHYDPKFADVLLGKAGAIGYEMYFGVDELGPAFQFGINPSLKEFEYCPPWNSPHKYFRRLENYADFSTRPSDEGYATAMNISWALVYDRLPDNGSEWPFEMICWARNGGVTWGGTDIWQRSEWGHWRFEGFTPQVRAAIRRQIIYKALKRYRGARNFASGGVIGKWQDAELGDPAFYAERLAPLVAKLDGYAKLAEGEIDDKLAEKLFFEVVPGWYDFGYEASELRSDYLLEQLTQ
jgi:hypothetical protein